MHLQLVVPDLFWPVAQDPAVMADLRLSALETLLAKGRRFARPEHNIESWLMQTFGVPDAGSAPLALQADGGVPGSYVWLRADPCHLRVGRDRIRLSDASAFNVSREEAEALVESLNQHFGDDGLRFFPMQPERWYLRMDHLPQIETTPIAAARGQDIDALLPRGPQAMQWQATLNELQMLMYQHPVNDAREARGDPEINSVWLWGAGTLQAPPTRPFPRVRSRDPLAAGLVQASGGAIFPLPQNAEQWSRAAPAEGIELIVLDALSTPAAYEEMHAWREQMQAYERDWFAPLLDALRHERIGMLTIHAVGRSVNMQIETTRQDLHYFWRRPKTLARYLPDLADQAT